MRRGDIVRVVAQGALARHAGRTGVVLKVGETTQHGQMATVLLDPTPEAPAFNHFIPFWGEEVEVIGRAVRLSLDDGRRLGTLLYDVWADIPPGSKADAVAEILGLLGVDVPATDGA